MKTLELTDMELRDLSRAVSSVLSGIRGYHMREEESLQGIMDKVQKLIEP